MKKCEKCKENEGIECVFYTFEHEGYLCKSCYRKWLKIADTIPIKNNNYEPHQKRYLEWLKEMNGSEMDRD